MKNMTQLPTPADGGSRAIHAAGFSVDDFDLEMPINWSRRASGY